MVHLIGVKVYGFSHNFRGGKGNKIEIRGLSITLHSTLSLLSVTPRSANICMWLVNALLFTLSPLHLWVRPSPLPCLWRWFLLPKCCFLPHPRLEQANSWNVFFAEDSHVTSPTREGDRQPVIYFRLHLQLCKCPCVWVTLSRPPAAESTQPSEDVY